MIGKYLRRAGSAFVLGMASMLAVTAMAVAPPDPVEFGVVVERGDLRLVQRWLDEGLDPEYQADRIGTGLMLAAWNGNIDMMALFVARGANPRRANRHGEQPLQLAAWNGHAAAVDWLLQNGAVLNREGMNWSALHYAVFNGHDTLARALIERGAEVNARSPNGSTPLMLAAREGRDNLAKLLLESGGDPKARNDWGDTALALAMRYDHYRVGKMISSPEEFAIAVKAPKEQFGEPVRSTSAPSEIDGILRRLRAAGADNKEIDDLRKQLFAAVESFKRGASPAARRPDPRPLQPRSLVITAKRGQPGAERAEVVASGAKPADKTAVATNKPAPVKPAMSAGQVSELLHQIRLAEAQGRPADDLKQQLYEAVEGLKK